MENVTADEKRIGLFPGSDSGQRPEKGQMFFRPLVFIENLAYMPVACMDNLHRRSRFKSKYTLKPGAEQTMFVMPAKLTFECAKLRYNGMKIPFINTDISGIA